MTQSDICNKYNINRMKLNRVLKKHKVKWDKKNIIQIESILEKELKIIFEPEIKKKEIKKINSKKEIIDKNFFSNTKIAIVNETANNLMSLKKELIIIEELIKECDLNDKKQEFKYLSLIKEKQNLIKTIDKLCLTMDKISEKQEEEDDFL